MKVNSVQNQPLAGTQQTGAVVNNTEDFSSYLQTTATLEDIFQQASDKYGVSKDLLKAIAKAESNFDPNATSRAGAQGVMQLMPRTAEYLGVTDSYDPYQNIMGGAKYIKEMLDTYDGNTTLALAAYNAGSNNVNKYGGVPPFTETQNYVVKVTSYMNEGVSVPDAAYAVSSGQGQQLTAASAGQNLTAASTDIVEEKEQTYMQNILDQIFSYDDYLRFLDLYMKVQELEQSKASNKDDESKEQQNDSYYSYQEIKYNPTVLNLLKGTEQI